MKSRDAGFGSVKIQFLALRSYVVPRQAALAWPGAKLPPTTTVGSTALPAGTIRLSRTWDLDAFILPVNSLAAH